MRLELLESCVYIIHFSESGLGQGSLNLDFGIRIADCKTQSQESAVTNGRNKKHILSTIRILEFGLASNQVWARD